MYERFLPKFKVVEINNSTAHRIGHAISQIPAYASVDQLNKPTIASVVKGDGLLFVENGIIVGLDKEGVLANYKAAEHSQPCLVYNDELVTGPIDQLDKYAEEAEVDKPVYVRALPLYLGDTFTTNNFSGTAANGFAKVENGVLTIQAAADEDTLFIAKKDTLPNGEVAVEFTYVGTVVTE